MGMKVEKEEDIRVEILTKYNEFAEYVNNIDVEALRETFTRKEIEALEKMLREFGVTSLPLKLSKLTDKMKKEEYPQLNSVHHFPVLNKMDFLTLLQQEALDYHLNLVTKGNFIYNLYMVTPDQKKIKMIENFLIKKGIAEKVYIAKCPYCCLANVSVPFNEEDKAKFDSEVMKYREFGDVHAGSNAMGRLENGYCHDCEENLEMDDMPDIKFQPNLKLIAERDRSLDFA